LTGKQLIKDVKTWLGRLNGLIRIDEDAREERGRGFKNNGSLQHLMKLNYSRSYNTELDQKASVSNRVAVAQECLDFRDNFQMKVI